MRGLERRVEAGLPPLVGSVASVFVSRWDKAVASKVTAELLNTYGIAVSQPTYRAYRDLLASDRWQRLENLGARPQRLLWASTGTKDPNASDILYIKALAAPNTVNTMPEPTLLAFADHGELGENMSPTGNTGDDTVARFEAIGIHLDDVAKTLQSEGAESFVASWSSMLSRIQVKSSALTG
jgi:transaldolase